MLPIITFILEIRKQTKMLCDRELWVEPREMGPSCAGLQPLLEENSLRISCISVCIVNRGTDCPILNDLYKEFK